jgi:hypothetical protein
VLCRFSCGGDCLPGYVASATANNTCDDVNECAATPNGGCDPLTKCVNTPGGYAAPGRPTAPRPLSRCRAGARRRFGLSPRRWRVHGRSGGVRQLAALLGLRARSGTRTGTNGPTRVLGVPPQASERSAAYRFNCSACPAGYSGTGDTKQCRPSARPAAYQHDDVLAGLGSPLPHLHRDWTDPCQSFT